jgi:hypothetical protein
MNPNPLTADRACSSRGEARIFSNFHSAFLL